MLEGRLSFQGDTQFGGMHSFLEETKFKETYYYVFVCANGVLADRSRHICTLHKKGHQDLKGGADIFQKRLGPKKGHQSASYVTSGLVFSNIYDFLSKGGILGEIGLVQFLIDCTLMRKDVGEMIYIPKDRIFDVLQSETKFFVVVHT